MLLFYSINILYEYRRSKYNLAIVAFSTFEDKRLKLFLTLITRQTFKLNNTILFGFCPLLILNMIFSRVLCTLTLYCTYFVHIPFNNFFAYIFVHFGFILL